MKIFNREANARGFKLWHSKSSEKHGDRFDYSKAATEFKTQKSPEISIRCTKHDHWFTCTPFNHLRSTSGGCSQCDTEIASSYFLKREEQRFHSWFSENFSDRLELRSKFQGMTEEMSFYCKIHGSISSHKPTYLMNNGAYGCPTCSKNSTGQASRLQESQVLQELASDMPDHVRLIGIRFDEERRKSLVGIFCDTHKEIWTSKETIKRSQHKCPKCGKESIGYAGNKLRRLLERGDKGVPTTIGVMEIEVFGISALKVGVTTRSLEDRYKWHLKNIFFSSKLPEVDAYILENQIHRKFKDLHDLRILKAGMRNKERWSGDTECYLWKAKQEILNFVEEYFRKDIAFDYTKESDLFEVPNFFPRSANRDKNLDNLPISVVGIDPETRLVVREFSSISDAARAGFKNISTILSGGSQRQLAGGLRWMKKKDYENGLALLDRQKIRGNPRKVRCIETGEIFTSITGAAKWLSDQGINVSSSHITSVCKGRRKSAGKHHWEYVGLD